MPVALGVNGGILGSNNLPSSGSAKGIWTPNEIARAVGLGFWPLVYARTVTETSSGADNISTGSTDPFFEYTTLLLPGNGTNGAQNNTFLDSSSNNFTITRNPTAGPNAPTQGTFSPFSQTGWGGAFNTSTTYLTVTDTANLCFGSSNFTIEAWVYRSASGATQTIASKGAATPTGWVFQISSADKLVFTDTSTSITGATSIAANTWTYVAVVRAGTGSNQTTLYVNGTSDGTGTSATNFNQTSNMLIGADRSSTNFANGYISNLRLSNTNRTISSTPTTALTADANTIFLSLNINRFQYTDSTAAFTNIAVTGTPTVVPFSPFNPTSSWSAVTNGGSGYFDGTGDYLTVPDNTAFDLAASDFVVEAWAYSQSSSNFKMIMGQWGTSNISYTFRQNASKWVFTYTTNNSTEVSLTGTSTQQLNAWAHVCAIRTGNTMSLFVNGTREATASVTGVTIYNNTGVFSIGGGGNGADLWVGYIGSSRIIKGTLPSGYDATQTTLAVPTAPFTSTASTSILTNFTNAGIYDATSKNDLETVGNAQISTAQSKFGGSSMYFDGTGDWLLISDQPIQRIGTGNFTIEGWVYRNSSGTYGLIGKGTGTTGWLVSLNSSNLVVFTYGSSTITSTGTVSATTWTHIAVVREGTSTNQTKIYINGTNDGTGTVSTDFNQTNSMYVGADRTGGSAANAYMQDVRVTNYARYTTNFTAPTAAFPTL